MKTAFVIQIIQLDQYRTVDQYSFFLVLDDLDPANIDVLEFSLDFT